MAQVTAMAMSLKSWPASSSTKITGRKTATVVRVEARIAPQTSMVPSWAEAKGDLPILRWRSMFSSTTMALSRSMPTAKEIPARLTTFRFRPRALMKMKVPITLIGMAVATTTVEETLRRNRSSTVTARNPPMRMFCRTRPMAPLM